MIPSLFLFLTYNGLAVPLPNSIPSLIPCRSPDQGGFDPSPSPTTGESIPTTIPRRTCHPPIINEHGGPDGTTTASSIRTCLPLADLAAHPGTLARHAGTDAAHVHGGLLATLTAWCEQHSLPYQGVPVGTWKKHACGKGNASKGEIIAAMRERGFEPADDNEADAIAILLWALETNGGLA